MIVDFHTHIFPPEVRASREKYLKRDAWFRQLYSSPRARLASLEDLITSMDQAGVDQAVVCGFGWADPGLCREHNDYISQAINLYPERLFGFASVQVKEGARAVSEIERCLGAGMCGIGELNPDGQSFQWDDEITIRPVVEAAIAHNLLLLTHTSEPIGHCYPGKGTVSLQSLYYLARCFPELCLVCCHWGGGLPFYELMPEVAEVTRNVYYDTAASPLLYDWRIFPIVISLVGASKILFGSDFPLLSQQGFINQIRRLNLAPVDLEAILERNAKRILPPPRLSNHPGHKSSGGKR